MLPSLIVSTSVFAILSMSIPLNLARLIDQIAFFPQTTLPTPHFVAYSDMYGGSAQPPPPSSIKGFNTFILGFLLIEGAWDNAQLWSSLTPDQRSSIKAQYAAAGIKLLVSAFGSTDLPTTSAADPITTANKFADWVKRNQIDGIDIDYEDLNAFEKGDSSAENWLITFTQQLRSQLPAGQYIITHALAPWFQPDRWGGGGYLKIHTSVGHLIDWYNVQFYNQGLTEYITCPSLLTASSSSWPNTTVFQIAANGVPLSKIVIGKPATPADASNGFVDPMTLGSCLAQGKDRGWTGGAMVWQYPHADSNWITEVRAESWPVV